MGVTEAPSESPLSVHTDSDEIRHASVGQAIRPAAPPRRWGVVQAILRFPAFDAVHHPIFRLVWLGQTCTSMGMWMDQVARGWLLYDLTHSPLQLGLLQGLQALPLLVLSPVAGAAADRYDRRAQIMVAQIMDALMYALVAALILTDQIQPWHVYLTAFAGSIVSTFHQPSRAAMIADAVPAHYLSNAVALTSVSFNVSRSIGPAIAGLLIALMGTAGSYLAQSLLYVLATAAAIPLPAALRFPSGPSAHHARSRPFVASIVEGWRVSWTNDTVRASLLVVTAASVFILPFTTLLPVFARDILQVGAGGQGALLTAMGMGAFCSSLLVATIGDRFPRGLLMLGGATLYGLSVILFAASPWFSLSVGLMVIVGVFHVSTHTLTQIVVQAYTPSEFRGRTMGVLQQTHVIQMTGGLLVGGVALLAGAPLALTIMAAVGTLVVGAIFLVVPAARQIR